MVLGRCHMVPGLCDMVPGRCHMVLRRCHMVAVRCHMLPERCHMVPERCHMVPGSGRRQPWLFPANFGHILGYFVQFKIKCWLSPADASSHRHVLSVSARKVAHGA